MITYKIIEVNLPSRTAQIRYSKNGEHDFYIQTALDDGDFNEAALHAEAVERAQEAQAYWDAMQAAADITLASDNGNIGNVVVEEMPDYNPMTQQYELVKTVEGDTTTYSYNIVNLSDDVIGSNVRMQRDDLLHHTDHHALSDRTLSDAMRDYRQALRDITEQAGFPTAVVWPTEPIE